MTLFNMTEQEIRQIIRQELAHFMKQSKFVFGKPIQIEDGNDIGIGSINGTRIGSETSKVGFFGNTPIVQFPSGYIVQPTGGTVIDFECRATVSDIKYLLDQFGLSKA